ncbi:MAG: ribosome biogenesis GTPase Der [Clostridia bacterium]|nr:ribosome biogenesis GTPase Der [Clostridia bacterium]
MAKPYVAIVGKPNVGKSTFFNKVGGERKAIVLDIAGITRDRLYIDVEWCGHEFTLIDTGGIRLKSPDAMQSFIAKQAEIAVDLAEVVLFFVDGKSGLTSEDYDIAAMLRKSSKPVITVVNKVDNFIGFDMSDFYALGLGEVFAVSAEHLLGIGDLLDEVVKDLGETSIISDDAERIKIAVVGKPNAGKSSIANKILGYDRTIVSDIAGTTRDAIDTPFSVDGKDYLLIDTAGIRKKRSIEGDSVEAFSVMRSLGAIRRADVCLVVLDAAESVSEQDVKIAGYAHEQGKPTVIVINKWDLIEKDSYTVEKFEKKLKADLAFMDYFKYITVSALTGQRINKLIEQVDYVYDKSCFRATTGLLNAVIADAVAAVEPPSKNGRRLKIKYATQPTTNPPTFVLFVNDSALMHFSYKRYLENYIRRAFTLDGTPIKLFIRSKEDEK